MPNQPGQQAKDHIASSLLARAHSPDTASSIFRERVKQRPLLLRPTSPDPKLNARSKRQYERLQKSKAQRKSKKPKPLSAKQKRRLCLFEVPKSQQKYEIYEPLHRMWLGYMREILGLSDGSDSAGNGSGGGRTYIDAQISGPILVSADYHGAFLEVVRSRCISRVGLKGIVVKDTKFTFEMATAKDVLRTVPKEHTVFRFQVPFSTETSESDEGGQQRKPLVFDIHGNQFETRATDRANKKFRLHMDPDL